MLELRRIDHSAGIAEREAFLEALRRALPERHVLLSTCDRVELYADMPGCNDAVTLHKGAGHLFRVAAGLESPLLGETQILHQVKESYHIAAEQGAASPLLHRLFQSAMRAGKRVRAETDICRGAVSHAQGALEIIHERYPDLNQRRIALIGVNNLNRTILSYLRRRSSAMVFLGNRTHARARALADEFGCYAFMLDSLRQVLAQTDILITATAAPHFIVHPEQIAPGRELCVIDLAVPRDVDPRIGLLPGVTLFNVSDIESYCARQRAVRMESMTEAARIVDDEVNRFVADALRRERVLL